MSQREATARRNLIINRLRRSPCSYDELMDYLGRQSEVQGYQFVVSRRTLRRDLDDILSLYGIAIAYDFKRSVYHIEADHSGDAATRILEAYDTLHALSLSDGLSKYVLFESRRPRGTEHFYGLLHAIQNALDITFTYEKYWDDTISRRTLEPYALKEFKGRWYVVGTEEGTQQVKTFGLDRITGLEITRRKFIPRKGFDAMEHFQHCFGIIAEEGAPKEIILSFGAEQGKYIKSYPLHASQQVIKDDAEELRISLHLHSTYDFKMELLAHGNTVRVLAPASLRKEIKKAARDMVALY